MTTLENQRRSIPELRAELRAAQKSGAGVPAYTRWINRRLARGVAPIAAAWGIGPNTITFFSAALSVAGVAVLIIAPAGLSAGIAAAILLASGYVLDSADGQVARLTRSAGPAGEWLDHVVDAFRTPLIHTGVAIACYVHRPEDAWVMVIALAYALLSSGQFMSQILAEQLSVRHGRSMAETSGRVKSLVLIPTDPGTLCWAFALWATPVFAPVYALLFAANLVHAGASLRRKHRRLT
ncbi:MAG: CDP-alcohol phosphatidyltransferase family protein [Microbacterium gubbeenense]|uniref:CDP-alcohol phosphatidyltransferase family protein n=1 Tax=Microbacterium gubbeenense TaxID=159896 RepID=UPI003F952462